MKINRLVIENFKSIERIELIEPNPFTVFVGPNGSGKSNIFAAIEFIQLRLLANYDTILSLFGGKKGISRRQSPKSLFSYYCEVDSLMGVTEKGESRHMVTTIDLGGRDEQGFNNAYHEFRNFCHLFVGNEKLTKLPVNDNLRLSLSASNLEPVLKRILQKEALRDEIFEWLELFVPGFKAIEIDDRDELHWFEESSQEYFTKDLVSDGTYNILALLAAVYQSKEPQFLCIEEPENGLHPDVIKEFVNLCRYANEQFGHSIWLNTHSQTLASQLTADEIVVVDKVNGATQVKQFKGRDFHGLRMDEAWLMNALGGGLPW